MNLLRRNGSSRRLYSALQHSSGQGDLHSTGADPDGRLKPSTSEKSAAISKKSVSCIGLWFRPWTFCPSPRTAGSNGAPQTQHPSRVNIIESWNRAASWEGSSRSRTNPGSTLLLYHDVRCRVHLPDQLELRVARTIKFA